MLKYLKICNQINMLVKCKILVKKDKTEGFGNIVTGNLLISYEIPMLFLPSATIDKICSFLPEEEQEVIRSKWKLKELTFKI